MIKRISTDKAPAAIGPYSQALDTGNMLFISGQIPVDNATNTMPEDITKQAKQVLANITNILSEAGLTTENVVKTTVFLTDLGDFAAVNEVYASFFSEPYPARSCVQVAALPKGAKIEIETIAVK